MHHINRLMFIFIISHRTIIFSQKHMSVSRQNDRILLVLYPINLPGLKSLISHVSGNQVKTSTIHLSHPPWWKTGNFLIHIPSCSTKKLETSSIIIIIIIIIIILIIIIIHHHHHQHHQISVGDVGWCLLATFTKPLSSSQVFVPPSILLVLNVSNGGCWDDENNYYKW